MNIQTKISSVILQEKMCPTWNEQKNAINLLMNMDTLHSYLTFYLLAINIAAFALYGIDKYKARKAKWRISEAKLLTTAVLGGSIGAWLGMKIWHHKTMHKKFKYSIPFILLIQIALMAYLHHIV